MNGSRRFGPCASQSSLFLSQLPKPRSLGPCVPGCSFSSGEKICSRSSVRRGDLGEAKLNPSHLTLIVQARETRDRSQQGCSKQRDSRSAEEPAVWSFCDGISKFSTFFDGMLMTGEGMGRRIESLSLKRIETEPLNADIVPLRISNGRLDSHSMKTDVFVRS